MQIVQIWWVRKLVSNRPALMKTVTVFVLRFCKKKKHRRAGDWSLLLYVIKQWGIVPTMHWNLKLLTTCIEKCAKLIPLYKNHNPEIPNVRQQYTHFKTAVNNFEENCPHWISKWINVNPLYVTSNLNFGMYCQFQNFQKNNFVVTNNKLFWIFSLVSIVFVLSTQI